jgi:hypothetical protein
MTPPQIGQLCQIVHLNTNGDTPVVGMVINHTKEDLAEAYSMKEHGPKFELWIQFLIEEEMTWLPYNETTIDLIKIL